MARFRAVLVCLLAALLACMPAAPASSDASSVNAFLSTYRADVGSSVKLPDGRVLWLFGDTIRADGHWDRNSAVVQDGTAFTQLPGTFLEPSEAGHWYWPAGAVVEGHRLRILAMDMKCLSPCGMWDMVHENTDVLTYSLPDLDHAWTSSIPARPSGAMWSQLLKTGGDVYVYGSYTVDGEIAKAVEVARVPYGDLTHEESWQYMGTRMDPSMELGTMNSVTRKAGGGYRLFSKRLDLFGDTIISYDSSTPYGPWTGKQTVASIPTGNPDRWTYGVEVHPEQAADPGKLMISYSTNCDALPCPQYGVTAVEVAAP